MVIFSDVANYPGTFLDNTLQMAPTATKQVWTAPVVYGQSIVSGQKYWIAKWFGPTSLYDYNYESASGGVGYAAVRTYSATGDSPAFPAGGTTYSAQWEYFATYLVPINLAAIGLATTAAIGSTKETRGIHASGLASLSAIGTAKESLGIHATGLASGAIVGLAHLLGGGAISRDKYQTILVRRQLAQIKGINWQ